MTGTMARRGRSWGVLLAVLLPLAALAQQGSSPEVRKYLNLAATLYENLEYEKALAQIERARKKASGAADDTAIALYQGIVLSDMGREERAVTAFKTGLSLDPDAKLPLDVSPKVTALFERARASVKKMLGPQLARQQEEERKRQEAEARDAELKRRREEDAQREKAERARLARGPVESRLEPSSTVSGGTEPRVTGTAGRASAREYAWIPAVGGAACAVVGTVLLFQAKGSYDALLDRTAPLDRATAIREEGKVQQTAGLALVGVGAAGLAASVVLLLAGGGSAEAPRVSAWAAPGNAWVGVSGALP